MKSYIVTLLGAGLLSGVLLMLSPEGNRRYLRLLFGLCTVALLVAPLPSHLASLRLAIPDVETEETVAAYEEVFLQTLGEASGAQVEVALRELLIRELSLPADGLDVAVIWEEREGRIVLKKAIVSLSSSAALIDPHPLIARVESLLSCPCDVVYL